MKIISKSEVYKVSIEQGDEVWSKHDLDNRTFARIDGNWKHNTGGSVFEWRSCHDFLCGCGCGYTRGELLEAGFQKQPIIRDNKLNKLLNG